MGDGAGAFGIEVFLVAVSVLAYLVFVGYPVWRILERLGFDVGPRVLWLAGLALVPVLVGALVLMRGTLVGSSPCPD